MEPLRQRSDFLAAAAGARAPGEAFLLQARQRNDAGPPRVGFTVSKKVGTAVERNRVRRRLREIVRLSAAGRLHSGKDYVLIGRHAALDLPFERLRTDFLAALARVHRGRRASAKTPASASTQTTESPAGESTR